MGEGQKDSPQRRRDPPEAGRHRERREKKLKPLSKLFGTDGIRGVAGEAPLDERTVFAVGRAVGEHLKEREKSSTADEKSRSLPAAGRPRHDRSMGVVLGADTRESSPWVMEMLAGGFEAAGVKCISAGVIPTPGVAQLVSLRGFAAGAMVSASHNPWRDNGLKFFGAGGLKFSDAVIAEVEGRVAGALDEKLSPVAAAVEADASLKKVYIEKLRAAAGRVDLGGLHLVLDCANGAAYQTAPELFESAGAKVTVIGGEPDGRNINEGCGALHPEVMAAKVLELGADAGAAFDGDADRVMLATGAGRVVNGDGILLAAAQWMKAQGTLKGGCVVGTVMANLGLELALRDEGLEFVRTQVGDRFVAEEMERRGANLGGEQSGHVIFRDHTTTGDGLLTALEMFAIARRSGRTPEELTAGLKVFPQQLRNVPVREKVPVEELPPLKAAVEEAEQALGDRGRVLVRYSGTENLLRVMVEAEDEAQVEQWTARIVSVAEAELGEG